MLEAGQAPQDVGQDPPPPPRPRHLPPGGAQAGQRGKAHFQVSAPRGAGPGPSPQCRSASLPTRRPPRSGKLLRLTRRPGAGHLLLPNLVRPRSARDPRSYLLPPDREDGRQHPPPPSPLPENRPPALPQARGTKADLGAHQGETRLPTRCVLSSDASQTKSAAAADPGDAGCRSEPPGFFLKRRQRRLNFPASVLSPHSPHFSGWAWGH